MPRRNKLPDLPDLVEFNELSQNNYVQKQKSLMMLQDNDIPLSSLKIIDTYLSKLDNFLEAELTPEGKAEKILSQKKIHICGGELEKSLGVTQIHRKALYDRLKPLMTPIDTNPSDEDDILAVPLFKRIKAHRENGYWNLELEMTEDAEELIFIPEHIHFLRYRLLNVVNLTSRYAYFLYMYLENERFKHTDWRIPLDELKEILGCANQPTYKTFKFFNQYVLLKAQKELAERTNCRFTYDTVRKGQGGKVFAITFHLEPEVETKYVKELEQISFDDLIDADEPIDITTLTEDELKAVSLLRLKVDNPLISKLSDTTIAACYRELDNKYGQYSGDYQKPIDYDADQFTKILDKVRAEMENKQMNGDPEIKNLNSYVRQATLNFWKEGN